jgi:hypothetical protein
MRYFLDTEFNESVGNITLLSIGVVAEDGREFYAVSSEFDEEQCNDWVRENVIPKLNAFPTERLAEKEIAEAIINFVGNDKPEFWGYYSDYDWVVFCWLFGTMINLPNGFPMYCHDLKQEIDRQKLDIHQPDENSHNALDDARWIADTWRQI